MSEEKPPYERELERFSFILDEERSKLEAMRVEGVGAGKIRNQEDNVKHFEGVVESLKQSAANERWQNEKTNAAREKMEAERKLQERQTAALLEAFAAAHKKPAEKEKVLSKTDKVRWAIEQIGYEESRKLQRDRKLRPKIIEMLAPEDRPADHEAHAFDQRIYEAMARPK